MKMEDLHKRRAEFRRVQKEQLRRLEAKVRPNGDTKLQNKLTPAQARRRNKQVKTNIAKQRKLKYKGVATGVVRENGFQSAFYSSNVWKFKIKNNDLMVGFLNGSLYIYYGVAKLFLGMLRTGSKGKFVWRNLRRKGVSYTRIN